MSRVRRALLFAVLVLGAACTRGAGPRESAAASGAPPPANGTSKNAAASSGAGAAADVSAPPSAPPPALASPTRVALAGLPVEVALPPGWGLLANQSDEGEGLAAFGPAEDDARTTSTAFLDGSQMARVPSSIAQATGEALARDACAKPADCVVLASEAIPGGYLVSLRTPQAVVVESWRSASGDRALRCGFEASALHGPAHGSSWLDDPEAVARARARGESVCRSTRALR